MTTDFNTYFDFRDVKNVEKKKVHLSINDIVLKMHSS